MSEKEEEKFSKEGLKKSVDLVGELLPVIEDERTGEILEGLHRLAIDPDWERKKVQTRNDVQATLIKIHSHYRRTRDKEETRGLLLDLAQKLEKTGFYEKEKICAKVAEVVPYSPSYVNELLPDDYKDKTKIHPAPLVERQKPGSIPPKIELEEELRPTPSEDKIPDELMVLICPHCGVDVNITLSPLPVEERRKAWFEHVRTCFKNPHREEISTTKPKEKEKKPIQRDIPLQIPKVIPQFCSFMLSMAASLAKEGITSCSVCPYGPVCRGSIGYFPVRVSRA